MAEKQRKDGEPRFPIGIRKRLAMGNKNVSERGGNRGRAPSWSVCCTARGCPSKGEDIKCSLKGLRVCPKCGARLPKNGWISND